MKKISLILSMIICCILVWNIIGTTTVLATGLQMTFTSNPTISTPGTNGILEVDLKSSGASSNIAISARSQDTTAIIALGEWDVTVGSLDAGDSTSALFEFQVPSTATPGLYQILVDISYSGGSTISQTAIIRIEDATVVDITSVTPSSIEIGRQTSLIFTLTNNRRSDIKNMLFTWEDANNLILPVGSDNRITVPLIAGNNHTDVPVVVMASSGISPGVFPLTITMEFYDQTGIEQTIVSTVGVQIVGTTSFDLVVQTSTTGSTTFAVVNTGANVASSVVVSIPAQMNYVTTGVSSVSLGNLDAGDYTLASFTLTSTATNATSQFPGFNRSGTGAPPNDRNFSGRNSFTNQSFTGLRGSGVLVDITYTDVFGIRQTIQKQVSISSSSFGSFSSSTRSSTQTSLRSTSGFSQSSDSGNNGLTYIIIGVVGIVIIFMVIQLGRKKKLTRLSKLFKGRKE